MALQWAGRGAADQAPGVRREVRHVVDQGRLAQAGGALEDEDAAGALAERRDRVRERAELVGALEQR